MFFHPPCSRRSLAVAVGALVSWAIVAGCGFQPAPGSPSSSAPGSAPSGASPIASAPVASAPVASSAPSACAIEPSSGRLASNRLLGVVVDPGGTWVRFQFGSPTGPPGSGSLEVAVPPFDHTTSGQAIEVVGERVVRIHFDGLLLFDELGNPTYGGPDRLRPSGGPIRDVVVEEAFEGVMNWLVGVDGPDCLRLRQGLDPLALELIVAPIE